MVWPWRRDRWAKNRDYLSLYVFLHQFGACPVSYCVYFLINDLYWNQWRSKGRMGLLMICSESQSSGVNDKRRESRLALSFASLDWTTPAPAWIIYLILPFFISNENSSYSVSLNSHNIFNGNKLQYCNPTISWSMVLTSDPWILLACRSPAEVPHLILRKPPS